MIETLIAYAALALFAMALVVPDVGENLWLNAATGKTNATAWTLRLFTVISPALDGDTEAADVTEASGGGYSAIALTAANWTTTPGSPTSSTYPEQTFTFTGPLTTNPDVLGYYVTNAAGALVFAEMLGAPFTPTNNGDTLDVTLNITLASITGD
jgi:hypothetical protein